MASDDDGGLPPGHRGSSDDIASYIQSRYVDGRMNSTSTSAVAAASASISNLIATNSTSTSRPLYETYINGQLVSAPTRSAPPSNSISDESIMAFTHERPFLGTMAARRDWRNLTGEDLVRNAATGVTAPGVDAAPDPVSSSNNNDGDNDADDDDSYDSVSCPSSWPSQQCYFCCAW